MKPICRQDRKFVFNQPSVYHTDGPKRVKTTASTSSILCLLDDWEGYDWLRKYLDLVAQKDNVITLTLPTTHM